MRTFQDRNFLRWEAYANPGDFSLPDAAQIVFHCLTDPARRARVAPGGGDKSDAERLITEATEDELANMLENAAELD